MIYSFLKIFGRFALKIFCGETTVYNKRALNTKGPLLVTANHPNSFLDAIIIGAQFNYPVHFLARGDAFKKPWHNTLLKMLNMIPIYRLSEGKENLHLNEKTFQRSQEILAQGGIVLIFIEGLCVHEYKLRPFKKGAARIAMNCFSAYIPLKILPLGINYSSFTKMGVEVDIHAGKLVMPEEIFNKKDTAGNLLSFNNAVRNILEPLVWAAPRQHRHQVNYVLVPFAFAGRMINALYYYPFKNFVSAKTKNSVFYHSVLFGILFLTYPVYVGVVSLALIAAGVKWYFSLSAFVLFPLLGYAAVQQNKYK